MARDMGNLAVLYEERGELDRAESLYRESLAIAERYEGSAAASIAATKYANLGDIALARGRQREARSLWKQAAELFRQVGDERYHAAVQAKVAAASEPG